MIRIQVPATSANLGSGFDSLGIALTLYNQVWMEEADKLRAEAQVCHEQCQTCRRAANSEHEKYIAAVRKAERVRDNLPE